MPAFIVTYVLLCCGKVHWDFENIPNEYNIGEMLISDF